MDIQGIKSFADISKFTPGVTFDEASHDITIRGIESTAGSSTTGVYIDDTPVQARNLGFNSNNTLPTVFDLNRVEVLRGPQGTLFGAGSEGGTVRYITNQPSLTNFSGFAHSEVSWTDHGAPSYELGFAGGGPLIEDKLGFRISAWGRRDGGCDRPGGLSDPRHDTGERQLGRHARLPGRLDLEAGPEPGDHARRRLPESLPAQLRQLLGRPSPIRAPGCCLNGTPDRQPDRDKFLLPSLKIEWYGPGVNFISNTAYYARKERVGGYSGTLYDFSLFPALPSSDRPSIYGVPYPTDPQGTEVDSAGDILPTALLRMESIGPAWYSGNATTIMHTTS